MRDGHHQEALRAEYAAAAATFSLLTDIRFRLLAFLPASSAAAAAILATRQMTASTLGFACFGLAVTLGLITYNTRNDQLYDTLVGRLATIERELGLPDGAFANRPLSWLAYKPWTRKLGWKVNHRTGVRWIYLPSIALWVYEAFVALYVIIHRHAQAPRSGKPSAEHAASTGNVPDAWGVVLAAAAVALVLGTWWLTQRTQKGVRGRMRLHAKAAVEAATATPVARETLIDECRALLDEPDASDITARLNYLDAASETDDREALAEARSAFYAGSSADFSADAERMRAARLVAALTDLPPEWVYDCASERRKLIKPPAAATAAQPPSQPS